MLLSIVVTIALGFSSVPEEPDVKKPFVSEFSQRPTDGSFDPKTTYTAQKLNECNDPGATPVIVDYDVNIDDVVALAFLAKSRMYEIKAVIVTGTAFANPASGAANTFRLLNLLGLDNVDVGIGPYYTQPYWDTTPGSIDFAYNRAIPKATEIDR